MRAAALAAAVTVALAASPARAFGSYDNKLETGSALALAVFGGVAFVPAAIALMDPPLTTQRIVGRSLVMAGSLVSIAFCVYYFASDDPLWIPHALGWGIGGGLTITGFAVWLSDDEELTPDPAPDGGPDGPSGPTDVDPVAPEGSEDGSGPTTDNQEPAVVSLLSPFVLPGGAGLLLTGVW